MFTTTIIIALFGTTICVYSAQLIRVEKLGGYANMMSGSRLRSQQQEDQEEPEEVAYTRTADGLSSRWEGQKQLE